MQVFAGDDPNAKTRMKQQQKQLAGWTQQDLAIRQQIQKEEREAQA